MRHQFKSDLPLKINGRVIIGRVLFNSMNQKYIYTIEDLIAAVKISENYCDVCRKLGLKHTGGNSYERVRNKIKELNLDTSHFKKSGFSVGKGKNNPRRTIENVLVKNQKNRLTHHLLKGCLLKIGRIYKCSNCSISEWQNKPLTLDIDHIDGDWSNCLAENLRFLCPNCHRQTNTFAGKNIKQ